MILELACGRNLLVNNKDNRVLCLGTIGLIVFPWKFDVFKSSIFALEANVFLEHQFPRGNYLTNRLHVAVCLFINRPQRTSNVARTKKWHTR